MAQTGRAAAPARSRSSRKRPSNGGGGRPAGRPRAKRHGCTKPRIYTPPLAPLEPRSPETEARTLGYDVIDFAEQVLEVTLVPWQAWFLVHALELNADGSLRFRTVVLLVARQNGKSTIAQVLTIWLMCVWGWPLILGTAQDLDVAEEIWSDVVDMVQENDELSGMVDKVVKVNGKKALELTTGQRYKVKAANRRAGRGLSGNLVLLDELREHQNWQAWGAITKTTLARAEAMILALSNAGDITSVVLGYLRRTAHRVLGDPDGICAAAEQTAFGPTEFDLDGLQLEEVGDDDEDELDLEYGDVDVEDLEQDEETLGLFEWSAPPGCDKRDRDAWAQANPSMGYTELSERNIAAALKEPDYVFRTEVLCQWMDGTETGPFPPGSWVDTRVEPVEQDGKLVLSKADRIVGPVVIGLAQAADRSMTYAAAAGHRPDGAPQVEVWAGRFGIEWVRDWLVSPKLEGRVLRVTGQSRGAPVSTLMKRLKEDHRFPIEVVDLVGPDLTTAHDEAFDAIKDGTVWHTPQPVLDLAAETAVAKHFPGGTWLLDLRESPADAAPLSAWIAALWLLNRYVPPPPPPPPAPVAVLDDDDGDFDTYDSDHGGGLTSDLATAGF
ncbi:terminase large subunit [Cellulosimicrobium cellulans]|uniref:terminase large subunit domain-containing protein n=1 Tax=Cellulosimicrobium cellulans TaxID=1710 RepID=UPI00214A81D8|nr:terminase large subunit [Cellulosimicrobium cellulans]